MMNVFSGIYSKLQSRKEKHNLYPKYWGWKEKNGNLFPLYTSKVAALTGLLKLIRCSCKGDCSKRTCTFRRFNLKFSNMCGECKDVSSFSCHEMNESKNE